MAEVTESPRVGRTYWQAQGIAEITLSQYKPPSES